VKEIKDEIKTIRESQIRMEDDVKYHIQRTDLLEDMVKPMNKAYVGMKWSVGAVIGAGFIAGAIAKINGLF
jgi:hypothetical protein